jgi:autotransporter-associated beta strand protein
MKCLGWLSYLAALASSRLTTLLRKIFLGAILALLCVQWAAGAVWTNTITGAPQYWNVAANWTPAAIPNGNGAVAFITNDIVGNQIINVSGPITIGSLTVGDANGTHSFSLAANGSALTFQNNGAAASLTQTATSRGDTLATDTMLADSLTIRNDSANPFTISGNISGAGGLSVMGPGTLVLAGASTYAGNTSINSSAVRLRGGVVQVPVPGHARWFDASTANHLTTNATGLITQWNDLSANQAHAQPQTGHGPSYLSSAVNGLGAIHFGPGPAYDPTSSDSLNFYQDTAIRTVFSIFKGSSFLLTGTNTYDFHRPNDIDPAAPLWVGAPNNWTSANIRNGATYVNGMLSDGTTFAMPTNANQGFNLVEVVTTGSVSADGFNRDRIYHAGDQWHGELLIYDTVLSEANRLAVEQYLNRKWFGFGGNNTLPRDTALALTGGATLDLAGTCQALRSLSGSTGSVVDNVAPYPTVLSVNGNVISTSFAGIIRNSGSGALSLVKNGTGTLTLQGANTYSGATLVNLGTLVIDGSVGPGLVTVCGNGTLAGQGSVGGSVILQFGGALSPGSATPGTLTVNGDLICSSGVQLRFALGTNGDRVVINGGLSLGGTLNITDAGGFGIGTFTLFSGFTSLAWNGPVVGAVPPGYAASFDTNTPPDGIIDPEQANRLRDIGAWLAQYGDSIYTTRGGPFKPGGYGASTYKGSTVYVHILSWAYDPLVLPPVPARILSQRLLTGGAAIVVQTEAGIEISVPLTDRQAVDTILVLELDMDASLISPMDVPVPVSLATGAAATASNVYQNQPDYNAAKAVDGNLQTRWATDAGTHQAWLELDLGSLKTFSRAVINEAFDRAQSFQLQWFDGSVWQTFWTGATLGNQWSQNFPPVTARRVRLNILDASEGPTVWEFQLFQ